MAGVATVFAVRWNRLLFLHRLGDDDLWKLCCKIDDDGEPGGGVMPCFDWLLEPAWPQAALGFCRVASGNGCRWKTTARLGGRATTATARSSELRLMATTVGVEDAGGSNHAVRWASGDVVRVRIRVVLGKEEDINGCRLPDRTLGRGPAESWAGASAPISRLPYLGG